MLEHFGLRTDLYQLTMAAGYHAHQRFEPASFELFVRKLPAYRSYLIVAGIEQALEYIESLRFPPAAIAYLQSLPIFQHVAPEFFNYLRDFRFSGEVWAMAEGTAVFPNEPILRVTAPLIEAQLLETYLLATINFQTLIASKAARIVTAAQGRKVVEFGLRRAHSPAAGDYAARAAFIGGCVGTSNVNAGMQFGIPVLGTAAHSWTMSFTHEFDAFQAFHQIFPEHTTLLLDTYDTINAAHLATKIGPSLRGVRLDSGDLSNLSKQVRQILDQAGMQSTQIMASGDLDEYKITSLLADGAPIDAFGVGTELSTSRDAPALAGVYKLVEVNGQPKMKLSPDKMTYPFCKQVWRHYDANGLLEKDVIARSTEQFAGCKPLLHPVMRAGQRIAAKTDLSAQQHFAQQQIASLDARFHDLTQSPLAAVEYSPQLRTETEALLQTLAQK